MIDNTEVEQVLAKLESLEDEALAVQLLREFNDSTKELGVLLMNKDQSLDHEEWKNLCDEAKDKVEGIVKKIKAL
jgi:ribonuclease PH